MNDTAMEEAPPPKEWNPHAFHRNLPAHHIDTDGVPFISKFAEDKARKIVALAESLELNESLFVRQDDDDDMDIDLNDDDDDDDDEEDDDHALPKDYTLASVCKKCARLQSQLAALEGLKHGGITQEELCRILLRILRLVTATVTFEYVPGGQGGGRPTRKVTLHFENVGYLYNMDGKGTEEVYENAKNAQQLNEDLEQRFALPEPGREALLSIAVSILSKKGVLRGVSNAALYPEGTSSENRFMMIIHWQALFRTLLRTAPYLDEHKSSPPPTASNSRQNTILRRTVQMIRHARHFFDQGIRPTGYTSPGVDITSTTIWEMVQNDVLHQTHTHAAYRGAIMLYLFMPSQCTSDFYLRVMPLWLQSWSSIDRCPDFDYMWLVLFCRARKHVSPDDYDWGIIRRRLLTHSQYWLQIPIGGSSMDKSFPRAASPRARACPARLKAFVGGSGSYEEGMDFVAKIVKLLVVSIGTNDPSSTEATSSMSQGTSDILRFLSFVVPYYNPSNTGAWTFTLGAFLHYFCYELARRVSTTCSLAVLRTTNPSLAAALCKAEPYANSISIPPQELVILLDALLPLCQQALYSKNGYVGRAGEAAMAYLAQIDPIHVTPPFLDFATNALDVSAVNLSHQAPSALSALARLIQPALRRKPSILLRRLPQILQLSLAGIDSNDQNKCIRTLIFYRGLTSWVPVVADASKWPKSEAIDTSISNEDTGGTLSVGSNNMKHLAAITTSDEYLVALEGLPETSLLRQYDAFDDGELGLSELLLEETAAAMGDWVLAFLDRIFDLLRHTGEREKRGKVANRHSSSDVQQARNFSRVLKESLVQIFASMDNETHKMAVRSVLRFIEEETLPLAGKDAAALCQAVAAARFVDGECNSPGFVALVPILMEGLTDNSNKTVIYRLKCLAGAVRSAGHGVVKHRYEISRAIDFALSSDDKYVFKAGCKLLRHTLSSLCEAYPLSSECTPRQEVDVGGGGDFVLGKSGSLKDSSLHWHIPKKEEVEFACDLLQDHVMSRINSVCLAYANEGFLGMKDDEDTSIDMVDSNASETKVVDIMVLRRCLRVLRYSLRGCAGLLLDKHHLEPTASPVGISHIPHEQAILRLLSAASDSASESLLNMRGIMCSFLVSLSSAIASETAEMPVDFTPEGERQNQTSGLISSDTKVCKELSSIMTMLLTRRSAAFRCQERTTVWKAQKQNVTDVLILNVADHEAVVLQRASQYGDGVNVPYKDGEDGGKTMPWRLLVGRLEIFYESVERNASFEVPRRLRRLEGHITEPSSKLFDSELDMSSSLQRFVQIAKTSPPSALRLYESLVDGLFVLCCHPNTQVRSKAIGVIDYAFTRFGWLVRSRIPRLLSAISLDDEGMKGKYGIPSCSQLSIQTDSQGKRKRLAEALKGVCSILAAPRAMRDILWSESSRLAYVKTICSTDKLISILPVEEMQKMVQYFQTIFSPFRSKIFSFPRATEKEQRVHEECLVFLLDILSDEVIGDAVQDGEDLELLKASGENHWRKRLLVGWFLCNFVDEYDMILIDTAIRRRMWNVAFELLEKEMGQPLQRVAIGLLGRLLSYVPPHSLSANCANDESVEADWLREMLEKESFCRTFGQALVFDHRADTSIGGGHGAQWSAGVEDILRDSSRFVAPRTLFPFKRTSQNSGTFKATHAQLVELILSIVGSDGAATAAKHLLAFAAEMAEAPPSEDQRNQQATSAEIFAGVCRALLKSTPSQEKAALWEMTLIPFLEEVIPKLPISVAGAFFDAIRFGVHSSSSSAIQPLVSWMVANIDSSLWQPTEADVPTVSEDAGIDASSSVDGFANQSKYLYLATAVVIEMEVESGEGSHLSWFEGFLYQDGPASESGTNPAPPDDTASWGLIRDKLLPQLVNSVGHPYETCRDHIAGCLFRIWRSNERLALQEVMEEDDPTALIIKKLTSLDTPDMHFKERYNSMITARKLISFCIHIGDAQKEFARLVIPLLPVAFEALSVTVDEGSGMDEDDAAKRALEAEVVKGFRYSIAEVSSSSIMSYPGEDNDISRVLEAVELASNHEFWQVRQAAAHFSCNFQGSHKFLFSDEHNDTMTRIVSSLLSDERREVSSAAMAALTGILAATPQDRVETLVTKYVAVANRSRQKKKKAGSPVAQTDEEINKEKKRTRNQQTSVFFLCAAVLAHPYETPPYVPVALAAISKHSFERSAPLGVRDTVKKCCGEYKKTHMSDNWEIHRKMFSQEQLESLEDVVSSPHYYA